MFKNYYILVLTDKKRILDLYKQNIYFFKIKYTKDKIYLYVNEENYLKINKYLKIYNISLYKKCGLNHYKDLIVKYRYFIISMFISILIIFILSNIIFEVNIMSDNKELVSIIDQELKEYNLSKYHFVKSYDDKEKIKNKILNDYKDKIEWLEIERIGTKYYIHLLERKISNSKVNSNSRNVIAKRNAIIMDIKSSKGEIVKKEYDYVNKGDVIISGNITKNDEIKNKVRAEGVIYGETWYNVKVELPISYHEKRYTGNNYYSFTLSIFNKRFYLFNKKRYKEEEYIDKPILTSLILPFSLNKTNVYEVNDVTNLYTYDLILEKGITIAREKLASNLDSDAKILSQKKLKLYEENNIIVIEMFFAVYENITDYEEGE